MTEVYFSVHCMEIRFVTLQYISQKYLDFIVVRSYTIRNTDFFSKQCFEKRKEKGSSTIEEPIWVPQRTFQ